MAVSENCTFTFTWRIRNFSMCSEKYGEKITSPSFVVDLMEKTEWNITLYPRGSDCTDFIACILNRTNCDHYNEKIRIGCSLAVFSVHVDRIIKKEFTNLLFDKNCMISVNNLIKRKDVFNSTNGMLPNDTLTIKCCLWRVDDKANIIASPVSDATNNCCYSEAYLKTRQRSAVTVIKIKSKSILWPIKSFSALQPKTKFTRTVESLQDEASFDITFYLNGNAMADQCIEIEIRRKNTSDLEKNCFVRGKLKTLGSPKSTQLLGEDEHYFEGRVKDDVWKFPTFIKIKNLRDQNYLCYTDDILYLFCEFHHSVPNVRHFWDDNFKLSVYDSENLNCFNCAKNEYLSLYRSGKYSDVTLQAGTRTFKVHKIILSLRSDVFSAMFESDMQEKGSCVVEIADFDSETVDRLLTFMYTNVLENLKQEDAAKLYSIADKYNVVCLKCRCSCVLMSTLCMSNFCQILTLADLHQDEDLLESVRSFIRMNSDEIFNSQTWADFSANNGRLAASIMLHTLKNNFLP